MSGDAPPPLEGIAIVGMAGRFPGAPDLAAFWRNLCAGVESISFFADEELLAAGIPPAVLAQPGYVKAAPLLAEADLFDAAFFGISPREAAVMDPQQRLFLENAWAALEDAGYDPQGCAGRIGVYAGTRLDSYLLANIWPNLQALSGLDPLQVLIGNDKDYLATQTSYRLNLRGPSIGVQTACSSGLVAVALACQSLLLYQCDMALAGAVSVRVPQVEGYVHTAGGIVSPDGHCRAFDAAAGGTIFGSGLGAVVLKRLEDAHPDGDHVYAVIKGIAVNNDGARKVGYTAPGLSGQAEVIAMAQAAAEVDPGSITYVEAHGTGTALGDPVEIAALEEVFAAATAEKGFCAVGSVKTNFGHLDTAAGIAGLIKTALALEHRQIPPSLHLSQPNPRIDFANGPFFVNTRLREWSGERLPRRAGVSSFGIGGTNAHAVLEEAPAAPPAGPACRWQLLPLSAASEEALAAMTRRLAEHLRSRPEIDLADVSFTLQAGRRRFPHRQILVGDGAADAAAVLASGDPRRLLAGVEERRDRPVAFLFPGQGAQHLGMGAGPYRDLAVFREELDRCAGLLSPHLGLDLRAVLLAEGDRPGEQDEARKLLARTALTQPALFAVEYALARLWMSWGLRPAAMAGHSIGEYVAACLAGVLSLPDALALVAARGRLMEALPEGAMLSVPLPAAELAGLLPPGAAVAAVNGPALAVAAGPPQAIAELRAALEARGVRCRPLHTARAFHSAAVEPVLEPFRGLVASLSLAPPQIPFLSNLTGDWITAAEATDPGYWAAHLRQTVRFGDNLAALLRDPGLALLEVGPGRTLSALARRHPGHTAEHAVLSSLPPAGEARPDTAFLLDALGRAWLCGVEVDWRGLRRGERRRRVPLPGYPFARERHWIEPPRPGGAAAAAAPPRARSLAECFYLPLLKQAMAPLPAPRPAGERRRWLVFADRQGVARAAAERFERAGDAVTVVAAGTLDPTRRESFQALLRRLGEAGELPTDLVHAWSVDGVTAGAAGAEDTFFGLLALAQAIGATPWGSAPLRITLLASGLLAVGAGETLCPEKATLFGPARVIPAEYPRVSCRVVDVLVPQEPGESRAALDLLAAELSGAAAEPLVALRGATRWVVSYEPSRLEESAALPARLRRHGVYLITGGLGGIGLVLAERLARTAEARLALLGRTPLPERAAWDGWLAEHGEADPLSRKIRSLQALEALGSEVLVLCADVADRAQMAAALERCRSRFGAVHGVVHAAGVPGGGILLHKERASAAAVLAPKVAGTLALDELLAGDPLDFLLLCSSTIGLDGGAGQVDYCAANAFLDVFAHARSRRGRFTVAVDWGEWMEVGMAAAGRAGPRAGGPVRALHPLVERRVESAGGRQVYATVFDPRRHWVLAEHRVGGEPVLPGTAFLEMARAALAAQAPAPAVELRNVFFLAPLRVPENGSREARIVFAKAADDFSFSIRSEAGGEHVAGRIRRVEAPPARRHHLGELLQRCASGTIDRDAAFDAPGVVAWGGRWRSFKKAYLGAGEGLALLDLPEANAAETAELALHPALLDRATACCTLLLDGGVHLPVSYGRLSLWRPLPPRLYSHFVRRETGSAGNGVSTFDVTLLDEAGAEIAVVEEFTLKRVDGLAPAGRPAAATAAGAPAAAAPAPRPAALEPDEGAEAFLRVLAGINFPQVVISRTAPGGGTDPARPAPAAGPEPAARPAAAASRRPAGQTRYVAPRDEIERAVAGLWGELLGIAELGVFDNFFELGGHSVMALQLISRLRDAFGVDLPLDVLFEAPTVAELAKLLLGRIEEGLSAPDLDTALADVERLSDEEVRRLVAEQPRAGD
jgi:phthiocerol/phenolphthiocerol synthesis type-I polyketide synthase E